MCWLCDHPGATELDYQDHLRRLIATFGWVVQGVERDGIHPPWAYTVGLTPHRRPELVITGMGLTRATQVLNGVAAHLLHDAAPEPGTQAALLDGPLVEVVRVTAPWAHLNMAVEFYGQRIRGLQLGATDRTLMAWGYGGSAEGWSRLKRADLPAFWVFRVVRRAVWRWLRVR